jgi:glycine/D-amino acid oxidase-like deaminating enzyme/nitrite reductase/ring-hydroxylating ferredoxin subunit
MSSLKTRSGPIWLDDASLPSLPTANRNLKTDVCVVGAGIAGLSAAYLLSRSGGKVVVIDDGQIASGQTLATTAHVSSVPDDRYTEIKRTHGADRARQVAAALTAAIRQIESIVEEERIECDFRRLDAYLFLAPGQDEQVLEDEFQAARETGVLSVDRVAASPLPSFDTGPCLRYQGQAQFQPLRYLASLTEAIRRRGGEVYAHTHATLIEGGKDAHVETHSGVRIDANAVVVATNTPVNDRLAIHTKQAPYLSYVVAARIPDDAIPYGLYWDTDDPFHYVRRHRIHGNGEGHASDYLIIGGEDHKSGQADDGEERFARLEAWARERFPEIIAIEHRWAGQVMESIDGLPFIGRNPMDYDNVFIATGFSGIGMTNGTLAGMIIRDLIRGRDNPWADLYHPGRKAKAISSLRQFAKENLNVAAQYAALVTPGEVQSVDEIAAGQGAILRRGMRKIAVYRSPQGRLHELSAICPHLGCVVQWNSTQETWDCPCHGSRFRAEGDVLNGPANQGLERITVTYDTTSHD